MCMAVHKKTAGNLVRPGRWRTAFLSKKLACFALRQLRDNSAWLYLLALRIYEAWPVAVHRITSSESETKSARVKGSFVYASIMRSWGLFRQVIVRLVCQTVTPVDRGLLSTGLRCCCRSMWSFKMRISNRRVVFNNVLGRGCKGKLGGVVMIRVSGAVASL